MVAVCGRKIMGCICETINGGRDWKWQWQRCEPSTNDQKKWTDNFSKVSRACSLPNALQSAERFRVLNRESFHDVIAWCLWSWSCLCRSWTPPLFSRVRRRNALLFLTIATTQITTTKRLSCVSSLQQHSKKDDEKSPRPAMFLCVTFLLTRRTFLRTTRKTMRTATTISDNPVSIVKIDGEHSILLHLSSNPSFLRS